MTVLVVTPMLAELDALRQACAQFGLRAEEAVLGRLAVSHCPELGLTLARGGTGKAQFAAQMQHLLDAGPAWDVAVCAGAAGALIDDVLVGDVVVATATVEHDFRNRFRRQPFPSFEGSPLALNDLRQLPAPGSCRIHFGVIASGDEDIVDAERRRALHDATGALAVAWEGAGGARACAFSGVPFAEIRGVTDSAGSTAASDFQANLAGAMASVASVIASWLTIRRTRSVLQTR